MKTDSSGSKKEPSKDNSSNSSSNNSSQVDPLRGRSKAPLRTRLLASQLIVLAVTVSALATVSRLYTPRYFVVTMERMEAQGVSIRQVVKGS
ncbi:MAG: hypothetical protein AAFU53_10000 [Cyanobacteria bacterium J06632_3]